MTKKQLRDKVRDITKTIYTNNLEVPNNTSSSIKYSEMLNKFPKINETLIELMSSDFTYFVEDILWIAPRPSTFKVMLKNKNYFILLWNGDSFNTRVLGKTYDISAIGEKQRAIKSIQELLITGPINPAKDEFTSQHLNTTDGNLGVNTDFGGGNEAPNFDFEQPAETPNEEPETA
jgi:hypothetical protein